jgi:hypothetical protein
MYWLNIHALKSDLRAGQVSERDVVPYLIAEGILIQLSYLDGSGSSFFDYVDVLVGTAAVILGTWYVFNRHRGGAPFLLKYITLGWVVGWRVLLVILPVFIVLALILGAMGGEGAVNFSTSLFGAVYWYAYFRVLGDRIAES